MIQSSFILSTYHYLLQVMSLDHYYLSCRIPFCTLGLSILAILNPQRSNYHSRQCCSLCISFCHRLTAIVSIQLVMYSKAYEHLLLYGYNLTHVADVCGLWVITLEG